uniref:Microtubule associated protein n=1 Tax=Macrostomum lignano TaxID=282301 RepID=A0A1I8IVD6_9PLAT
CAQSLRLPPYFPPRGLPSLHLLTQLEQHIAQYEVEITARQGSFNQKLQAIKDLCGRLGLDVDAQLQSLPSPGANPDEFIPSEQDLNKMQRKLDELQARHDQMLASFTNFCQDIRRIATDIEYLPETAAEAAILSDSTQYSMASTSSKSLNNNNNEKPLSLTESAAPAAWPLTDTSLSELAAWRLRLVKHKAMLVGTCDELRAQVALLRQRLRLGDEDDEFQLSRHQGYRPSDLAALQSELARCQNLRDGPMASAYAASLRREAAELAALCFASIEDAVGAGDPGLTNEALEARVEQLRNRYESSRELYDTVRLYQLTWEAYLDVEQRMKDPSIFSNRGGILLKTEKEKKHLLKELPRVEARVAEQLRACRGGDRFKIDGRSFEEHVQHLWDGFKAEREAAKANRRVGRRIATMKRQYQAKATKQKQQQQNLEATEAKQLRQAPVEFGPYLSDRQWATIREDLSADGSCWEFCDFHRSHRDPYLAGEDGLLGICDSGCRLCFAWGFWNGKDAFVKEKLFGLTGGMRAQGNHGEDVKEAYFYQLNSPSHDYMRAKYIYPVEAFPYDRLLAENAKRSVTDDEFEIYDTGVFDKGYWEICVEYARDDDGSGGGGDTVCVMTAKNCSDSESTLHALPTVWFRNTWNTVYSDSAATKRADKDQPRLTRVTGANKNFPPTVECRHPELPTVFAQFSNEFMAADGPGILFTRNETEEKNAISRYLTAARAQGGPPRLPRDAGSKCSSVHQLTLAPGAAASVCVRLSNRPQSRPVPLLVTNELVARQRTKTEAFYAKVLDWLPESYHPSGDLAEICRLAYSGLLWSKQYYEYRPTRYLKCREAAGIRNAFSLEPASYLIRQVESHGWEHLDNADILSMPDKWEFPWYASWDTGFQAAVLADVDPDFAKAQLELMLSDRYMSPEGQNPPVLAWSAYEVFKSTGDLDFARRIYPRLKLNFAWWLRHRRVASQCSADDSESDAVSQVPDNCRIYQADAYAWVFATGLHCLRLAAAAGQSDSELCYWLDWLARLQRGFRHFDDAEGFCFDILEERGADGVWRRTHVRILSMVGMMPLTAVMDFDWSDLAGREAVAAAIDRCECIQPNSIT